MLKNNDAGCESTLLQRMRYLMRWVLQATDIEIFPYRERFLRIPVLSTLGHPWQLLLALPYLLHPCSRARRMSE